MTQFDTDVERQKRQHELALRKSHIAENACKTEPVQEPETEDDGRSQPSHRGAEHVLDRDVGDRNRDQRLDQPHPACRDRDDAQRRQTQCHRMGHGEGADLPQERTPSEGEEEEAQNEKDVIEPLGNDVIEARESEGHEGFARRGVEAARAGNRFAQVPILQKGGIGPLDALLPHDQAAERGIPSEGDCLRLWRQVGHEGNCGIARKFEVFDIGHAHGLDPGIKQRVVRVEGDQGRDLRPFLAQFRLESRGLQRALFVIGICVLGIVGICDPGQVHAREGGLERHRDVDGDRLGPDRQIGNCGLDLVGPCRRANHRDQDQRP